MSVDWSTSYIFKEKKQNLHDSLFQQTNDTTAKRKLSESKNRYTFKRNSILGSNNYNNDSFQMDATPDV